MTLRQEDTGEIKYEVRSTKYEVKELGATELRRGVGRRQNRNEARGINQSTREVEAPLVRRAAATRMGISMTANFEILSGQVCHKIGDLAVGDGTAAESSEAEVFRARVPTRP